MDKKWYLPLGIVIGSALGLVSSISFSTEYPYAIVWGLLIGSAVGLLIGSIVSQFPPGSKKKRHFP